MGKPEKKSIAQHKLEKTEKREQRQHDFEEGFQAREHLQQRIIELAPAKGSNPLADSEGKDEKHWFKNYPISYETQQGLFNAGFMTSTDIQHATMLHGLCGRDVLAAAKTGSGKTLAFLIPVLERLYHSRWNQSDGLGALIITPTRELAVQIFTVLKKIGMKHDFSAGLLIGGKQILDEKESIGRMNILVATPGRLLQHMDETPTFSCDNLRILVLDEADRILEMGFQETMNSIISFLPPNRQSLLFSATQTRSIKDLARLSLKTPEFISDMKEDSYSLPPPERLQQSVMVVPLWEKMNCLWSFLKSHLNSKVVVFLSTGKQIRYVHAVFSKMRVGTKVYSLHGSMNQAKRMAMYSLFEQTPNTVLLATDVAARGLDFPSVDWILQLDCPDTPQTYIHRVGRTARHQSKGKSLLLLTPEEEPGMMASLARHNIQPKRIKMNPSKQLQTGDALASVMAKHPDIKVLALKAFVTYFKFIFMQPDKTVFDVQRLPASRYARSLGLIAVPVINILQNSKSGQESLHELEKYEKETNTAAEKEARLAAHIRKLELEEEGGEKEEGTEKKKTKLQKLLERKNPALSNPLLKGMVKAESDDDDILVPKKGPHLHETLSTQDDTEPIRPLSKSAKRRQKKKAMVQPTTGAHFKFDEDGESTQINSLAPPPDIPPLEWFARVKAETHSHSKGDREDVTTLRRQKKYAAMDRAAERARQGKAVQGEEDEDGEGGEEWEEGGEYDGKYDDDNDNDDNDTEDREREEEEEPEVKAYNKKVTATKKRNNEKFNDELESLDLEEQERLALEILKKRRKA